MFSTIIVGVHNHEILIIPNMDDNDLMEKRWIFLHYHC